MIIAYDVSHIQTRRGGIGRYSLALLKEMLGSGTEIRFLLHGWSRSIDLQCLAGLVSQNCTLNAKMIPGFVKRAYWDRMRIVRVSYFTGQFNLFHSADAYAPPLRKEKLVVTVHDLLSRTHPQYFERWMLRRDRRLERPVRRADAVLVPSQYVHEQVSRSQMVPGDRIHIVPPPLGNQFTEAHGPLDGATLSRHGLQRPYILFVGTVEPRKNIPALVKAFETLCGRGMTDVDLVVVGKMGWMGGSLPGQISSSPYAGWIRWLKYVPESELGALYRGALFFVYPSFVEGYGLPVAEAMASGVPVITSDSSGMREVAGGAALLVDPSSIADIAGAMATLAGDSAARSRLRKAGVLRAKAIREAFDPRTVIRIYESLVPQ